MKIVKYIVIFVLFGVVGTLIASFFAPESHVVSNELMIKQPLEMCWEASLNPDVVVNWVDDLDTVQTVDGVYDEKGYSALFLFKAEENTTTAQYAIDSIVKHQAAKNSMILNDKLLLETTFVYEAIDSAATKVTVQTVLKPSGWLFKLMLSGAGDGLQTKRKNELENMKKWLENQRPTTPTL